jgi:hypothetical protein
LKYALHLEAMIAAEMDQRARCQKTARALLYLQEKVGAHMFWTQPVSSKRVLG